MSPKRNLSDIPASICIIIVLSKPCLKKPNICEILFWVDSNSSSSSMAISLIRVFSAMTFYFFSRASSFYPPILEFKSTFPHKAFVVFISLISSAMLPFELSTIILILISLPLLIPLIFVFAPLLYGQFAGEM
jgi:hypothetical protein